MTSNILSPEERFAKIVHELAIELEKAETENAELRRKLMIANYPVEHAGDAEDVGNTSICHGVTMSTDTFAYRVCML